MGLGGRRGEGKGDRRPWKHQRRGDQRVVLAECPCASVREHPGPVILGLVPVRSRREREQTVKIGERGLDQHCRLVWHRGPGVVGRCDQ